MYISFDHGATNLLIMHNDPIDSLLTWKLELEVKEQMFNQIITPVGAPNDIPNTEKHTCGIGS